MSDQPTPRSVLRGLCIDDQSADLIADRIASLQRENAALKIERNRLRVVLQDIADASGFDNIGNWARNKAKNALAKEAKP